MLFVMAAHEDCCMLLNISTTHQHAMAPSGKRVNDLVCVQAKSLERQLSDTERRLQEMVTASQRQTNISQHEVQACHTHLTYS